MAYLPFVFNKTWTKSFLSKLIKSSHLYFFFFNFEILVHFHTNSVEEKSEVFKKTELCCKEMSFDLI